jgi:uncharacterized lipoprotein YddW (UPF0748 family)
MVLIKSTSGLVYFNSKLGPVDTAWTWDFFGTVLDEAHRHQMTVHPWFCVFTEGALAGQIRRHPEWLIHDKNGESIGVVNPVLPEVRRYEISLMTELAELYPVDWIHLDYIRYPCNPTEDYFSFDRRTRAEFQEFSGQDPLTIKAMDSGNIVWNEWISWNAGHVTQFIKELRDSLKHTGRTIRLSAAVFPNAENAKVLIGQDWKQWAEEGLIDVLCPMLYTNNQEFFDRYVQRAVAIGKNHCQVSIGIGIGTSHNQNTPEGMLQEIAISMNHGADGFVLFSSSSLGSDFLRALESEH